MAALDAAQAAKRPMGVGDMKREIVRLGGRTDDCLERKDLEERLASLSRVLP